MVRLLTMTSGDAGATVAGELERVVVSEMSERMLLGWTGLHCLDGRGGDWPGHINSVGGAREWGVLPLLVMCMHLGVNGTMHALYEGEW